MSEDYGEPWSDIPICPGAWKPRDRDGNEILRIAKPVAIDHLRNTEKMQEEAASDIRFIKRITACVNACQHIPTKDLLKYGVLANDPYSRSAIGLP